MNRKTAPSGWALATTGGTFMITLCRPGTSYFQVKIGLTMALNQPVPQIATTTDRMTHGSQASAISEEVAVRPVETGARGRSDGTPAPSATGRGSP